MLSRSTLTLFKYSIKLKQMHLINPLSSNVPQCAIINTLPDVSSQDIVLHKDPATSKLVLTICHVHQPCYKTLIPLYINIKSLVSSASRCNLQWIAAQG